MKYVYRHVNDVHAYAVDYVVRMMYRVSLEESELRC